MDIIYDGRRYAGVTDADAAAMLGLPAGVYAAAALQDAREQGRRAIDAAAVAARGRHASPLAGQDGIYQMKAEAAAAFVAAGRPADASAWPMLTAEAQARAMTVDALADEILAARTAWIAAAANIEAIRVSAKQGLDLLDDATAIEAAVTAARTALRGY